MGGLPFESEGRAWARLNSHWENSEKTTRKATQTFGTRDILRQPRQQVTETEPGTDTSPPPLPRGPLRAWGSKKKPLMRERPAVRDPGYESQGPGFWWEGHGGEMSPSRTLTSPKTSPEGAPRSRVKLKRGRGVGAQLPPSTQRRSEQHDQRTRWHRKHAPSSDSSLQVRYSPHAGWKLRIQEASKHSNYSEYVLCCVQH